MAENEMETGMYSNVYLPQELQDEIRAAIKNGKSLSAISEEYGVTYFDAIDLSLGQYDAKLTERRQFAIGLLNGTRSLTTDLAAAMERFATYGPEYQAINALTGETYLREAGGPEYTIAVA